MSEYRVSYLVTTYNKLPYLQHVLGRLVAARQPDEEIVVADGGSTDGTVAYLQGLHAAGQIQQLVSERDKGESHGFNKCSFMARGEILKYVTDDDAFCYPAIRQAATFMLAHPEVDVMMGYNAAFYFGEPAKAWVKEDPAHAYQRWFDTGEPFQMIGLPLIIRRSSLPLTGLFSTGVVMVDLEFIYRISNLKVNIAWCTALLSAHISHPDGNFNRMSQERRDEEHNRIVNFYTVPKSPSLSVRLAGTLEAAKRPLRPLKRRLFDRYGLAQYQNPEEFATGYVPVAGEDEHAAMYRMCDEFMAAFNAQRPIGFIHKLQGVAKVMSA